MQLSITKFEKPVYVFEPVLPDLNQLHEKLSEIWASKYVANMGPQHRLLNERITEFLKVSNTTLFSNGTLALMAASRALDLEGEVITTPFTFAATPHSLVWNNLTPVFCDINPVDLTINPARIEEMITPRTSAIMGVHVYGNPCDVVKIQEIADKYNLKVIYDAAHAFGTTIDGIGIGNFGDMTMFSFHATKLFNTIEGGALCYKDEQLMDKLNLIKNFGIKNEEEVVMAGFNAKLNEVQSAVGLLVLDMVEEEQKKRMKVFDIYKEVVDRLDGVEIVNTSDESVHSSYQYFAIRIDAERCGRTRDEVYHKFKNYNVFTRRYFYPLCSDFECYRDLPSSAVANLPVAKQASKEVLCLPFYGSLLENNGAESISHILRKVIVDG
ncbi:DegT/DnrJ/EryC1/StrS family aminotransferase [Cohnella thailandensis]|uniref:DegT/DnrJ/EryC1/StrS family aminotransferase n=1 Tax=Cohnella thailandensis TaxID=557557 RepID=A0A841SJ78_9BACL|nr:DegT/DnrJ/EryC1/StrS family aminotransferase [Cohnella thailandensis]MBB6632573.1 DegT/DnrJ/EryC1/StrS family aminotransferase [Cohnella thailandensis]MBP1971867.1 dTDP-4-amino-4,6-dideoxygalactose transaminase [Cohnella thailandensis]